MDELGNQMQSSEAYAWLTCMFSPGKGISCGREVTTGGWVTPGRGEAALELLPVAKGKVLFVSWPEGLRLTGWFSSTKNEPEDLFCF